MSKKKKKNWWKSMDIAHIDRESLHIFWMTWEFSIKFIGKMWLMIILNVLKKQYFTLSLEDSVSEKPHNGWGRGHQIEPFLLPSLLRVRSLFLIFSSHYRSWFNPAWNIWSLLGLIYSQCQNVLPKVIKSKQN